MAARRTRKKTTRRRRSQGVNILNVAQSAVVANAATKAIFGTDLVPFLTEGWLVPKGQGTNNSWELSLAELAQGLMGGGFSQHEGWAHRGLLPTIRYNLRNNTQAVGTMLLAPVAFSVAKKLTAKPRRDANKLLKMAGLSSVVKV